MWREKMKGKVQKVGQSMYYHTVTFTPLGNFPFSDAPTPVS